MNKATKIEIRWSESNVIKPGGETFEGPSCWQEANARLLAIASAAPPDMLGYQKTDVVVAFSDGETYEARMDVKPIGKTDNDTNIGQHILDHLHFWSGQRRPAHLTPEQYNEVLSGVSAKEIEEINKFLAEYEIIV